MLSVYLEWHQPRGAMGGIALLQDGTVDFVISDLPCLEQLKKLDEYDVQGAWHGISTLNLSLSFL